MSTYVLSQALAFQDFHSVPALVARPLRAHIAGGHAQLVRFRKASEQASGLLGFYDSVANHTYAWPNRISPSVLDTTFTKVWAKNVLLQYFSTQIGGGHDVTKLTGYGNRIHATNLNFTSNTVTYPRSAVFNDRDVKVGDIVKVRGIDTNSVSQTLWTSVKAIHGDPDASVIAAATSDVNNAATQSASAAAVKSHGENNGVIVTPDGTTYNGLASGNVTETYDILVTQASVGEDHTKAIVRVISGSGTDDQTAVVPAALHVAWSIGTRGLKVTLSTDHLSASSLSATTAGDPYGALVVGHRWRVTVHQAFTAPVPTSGGTFTGFDDTTYVVTVSLGGKYADVIKPTISVSTINGVDLSGPTAVTAAATAVAIGTQGATIKFSGTALRKGDTYYVACVGSIDGPERILELNSNLAATLAADTELDLTLFINKPSIQISAQRTGFAPLLNWTQTDSGGITINTGITAYDPTWTLSGVPLPLPLVSDGLVYSGVYVEYRAWLPDLVGDVFTISDLSNLDVAISGANDPDNPLKFGVANALNNSNGSEVLYSAIADPNNTTNWSDQLSLLADRNDVYSLVPLTSSSTVQTLYAAHVSAQSVPEIGHWRETFLSLSGVPEIPLVSAGSIVVNHTLATTSDGLVCLCVIEDDPQVTGTQYTILRCTSSNSKFVTNGVAVGDIVRTQYIGDGFGHFTYTEYVVSSVDSEDQLHLLVGAAAPVSVGIKTEIWRNLSPIGEALEIASHASTFANKRVMAVWPDQVEVAGAASGGMFLCAALAGLASGVLPQQTMSRLEIAGFSSVRRSTPKFTGAQLRLMSENGVWVVTQDRATGTIYTRLAVSTAPFAVIDNREEMVTRNVDSIAYRFEEWLAPFTSANVTPAVLANINTEVKNITSLLQTEAVTALLGGQLISSQITTLRQHQTLLDHIVLNVQLVVPLAINAIDLTLTL